LAKNMSRELGEISESTYIFADTSHLRCWPTVL
jgi:hypothetical protein